MSEPRYRHATHSSLLLLILISNMNIFSEPQLTSISATSDYPWFMSTLVKKNMVSNNNYNNKKTNGKL